MIMHNTNSYQYSMPQRRVWSAEQDKVLKILRQDMQITKWSVIAKKMAEQYNMPDRTGKQCRQRYHNHLDSTILRTQWTTDEEKYLYQLHDQIGNKWAIIAQKLPGRTDNCVKNHFYSKMRKALRKLNKIIYQYFKKEIKQIKMTVLYKIIEATDQRFKISPNVDEDISQNCCKLKNILLLYSNDQNNLQNDIPKLGQICRSIHQFSSKYRRKPKKTRRPSNGPDIMKLPKFQSKIKSTSDCQGQDSEYSMVISHQCDDENQDSYEIGELPKKQLQQIKQVIDDLKDSVNSKIQPKVQNLQKIQLIKPPAMINTLNNNNKKIQLQNQEQMQQFLRNEGVLQKSLQFSGNGNIHGSKNFKGDSSHSMDEQFNHKHNFLGQSIEKLRLDDMNFDVEIDQQNRLFISN